MDGWIHTYSRILLIRWSLRLLPASPTILLMVFRDPATILPEREYPVATIDPSLTFAPSRTVRVVVVVVVV